MAIAGVALVLDCDGALYWPDAGLLAISDLHLEKGSSFAARGVLLPPYDTATTLARLAAAIARYRPQTVVALGDSFHDGEGAARMLPADRDGLRALQRRREWIWIAGNHDPDAPTGMGGSFAAVLALGALSFRHEPSGAAAEIAGHLHPVARVSGRGCSITRRCFASDGMRLLMPAYPSALDQLTAAAQPVDLGNVLGEEVRLLPGRVPDSGLPIWLVDCPALYRRSGTPYGDDSGTDWPDNAPTSE